MVSSPTSDSWPPCSSSYPSYTASSAAHTHTGDVVCQGDRNKSLRVLNSFRRRARTVSEPGASNRLFPGACERLAAAAAAAAIVQSPPSRRPTRPQRDNQHRHLVAGKPTVLSEACKGGTENEVKWSTYQPVKKEAGYTVCVGGGSAISREWWVRVCSMCVRGAPAHTQFARVHACGHWRQRSCKTR